MIIRKNKKVTTNTIVGYKCDNCKKTANTPAFPDTWHHFSSQHNEWGNDSVDSYNNYHVCSPECYIKKLTEVINDELEDRDDAEVDGKQIQFARLLLKYLQST